MSFLESKKRFNYVKIFIFTLIILGTFFISACEFMFDEELMAAVKKGSLKMCDELNTSRNPSRIDDCYAQIAVKKGDEDICPKIKDGYYKSQCYEQVAIKNKNQELCKYVTAEVNQRECYTQIAIGKKNSNLCKEITEPIFQDRCYIDFAKASGNVKDCYALMSDSDSQDECFVWFAENKKSEEICAKILNTGLKDDCYQKVAIATQGNLLCDKIELQSKKDQCNFEVASQMGSTDTCNKIDNGKQLWITCIKQVAITQNNKAICDVLSPEEKKSCQLQIENARAVRNANN